MAKIVSIALLILTLSLAASSQKLGKPTLTSAPLTETQQKTLREGVDMHDAKNYAEAVAKYRSILAENPDATGAMYELSLSLDAKGDKLEGLELAYRGTRYISDELPLFYVMIANRLDDNGKPEEAIKIYHDGLKLLKGDKRFGKYSASLNYNLGVTYVKQKKYAEARRSLKEAVEDDFSYASPHYLLAVVYKGTKYKIPAFLAAARLVSLEYSTQRTGAAVSIITDILKPASKDPKSGNINIFVNLDAPKDEGDFGMFELLLGTLTTVRGEDDKKKTENQMFIDAIGTIISILEEDKKLRSTFVGSTYIPFMADMKKNGHVEAFGNMLLYINKNENTEAAAWVKANDAKLGALLNWAKSYHLPLR